MSVRDVIDVKPNPFYGRPILFRGFRAEELIHWIMEICQAVSFHDCSEYQRVNISISRINSIAKVPCNSWSIFSVDSTALKPVSREPRNISAKHGFEKEIERRFLHLHIKADNFRYFFVLGGGKKEKAFLKYGTSVRVGELF